MAASKWRVEAAKGPLSLQSLKCCQLEAECRSEDPSGRVGNAHGFEGEKTPSRENLERLAAHHAHPGAYRSASGSVERCLSFRTTHHEQAHLSSSSSSCSLSFNATLSAHHHSDRTTTIRRHIGILPRPQEIASPIRGRKPLAHRRTTGTFSSQHERHLRKALH